MASTLLYHQRADPVPKRRKLSWFLLALIILALGVWANNSSWLYGPGNAGVTLLAHRGVHQMFHRKDLTNDTCTASRIDKPRHGFLENTLPSMKAAFASGADIVEFDVHPTTDGQFAVIHDWTLDCRTDGKGVTREHSLAELKALDIGYGYTADGGKTYPFRGKGVGAMPSLDEVFAHFPDKRFLINIKSDGRAEGDLLAARLAQLAPEQRVLLMAYGGARPIERLKAKLPDLKVMSKATLKRCLLRYISLGWTGYVPKACHNSLLLVPINVASWIWGYPHKFVARMQAVGTQVFITGIYSGNGTTGIDNEQLLMRLPRSFDGGIWTNRIELIGPIIRKGTNRIPDKAKLSSMF
jgi:glycerophosphoryl diester phosphodiesterase